MADIAHEAWTFLSKIATTIWLYVCLVFIGVVGMFGFNFYMNTKMTWQQRLGAFLIACFIGAVVSITCYINEWHKVGAILVPMTTLASKDITLGVMSYDWRGGVKKVLREWLKSLSNKLK